MNSRGSGRLQMLVENSADDCNEIDWLRFVKRVSKIDTFIIAYRTSFNENN